MSRLSVALVLITLAGRGAASAQETSQLLASADAAVVAIAPDSADTGRSEPSPTVSPAIRFPDVVRPSPLMPMYASFAALQAYDLYTTARALGQGAREGNPVMPGIVENPVAFFAVKGASTFASIYAAEHLWRSDHRKSAIALMAITNGLMVWVAAHNTSVLREPR